MNRKYFVRPSGLVIILLFCMGASGCPTQVGCGVSGGLAGTSGGFSADTWNCQVGMQFAKGVSVTTPQQARMDLLAKKDSVAIQVASLKDQVKNGSEQAFGFGGKDSGVQQAQVESQLQAATRDIEQLNAQVGSIDQLQPPSGTTVLSEGTWTMQGDRAVFQSQSPYAPGKKYVIPYVVRSERGEVLEMGYLPVESVQVESHP